MIRRRPQLLALAALWLRISACAAPLEPPAPSEDPLSPPRRAALMIGTDEGKVFCSGVRVGERQVLTAQHCDAPDMRVGSGSEASHANWAPVTGRQRHSDLDLALLELAEDLEPAPIIPLEMRAEELIGQPVLLIAFGRRGEQASGEQRLTPEDIVGMIDDHFALRATTAEAPCAGDSGGPLLIDTPEGWHVAGLLTGGSLLCNGEDRAIRSELIAPWLDQLAR